jgi:hypothetical protein
MATLGAVVRYAEKRLEHQEKLLEVMKTINQK